MVEKGRGTWQRNIVIINTNLGKKS
jgi:hypothetical protein